MLTIRHRAPYKNSLPVIREIEEKTADLWLSLGTLKINDIGSENTYYENEFGMLFYCKNYPQTWKD